MKLKKLLALAMVSVMTLSMAACGGKDDASTDGNKTDGGTTEIKEVNLVM